MTHLLSPLYSQLLPLFISTQFHYVLSKKRRLFCLPCTLSDSNAVDRVEGHVDILSHDEEAFNVRRLEMDASVQVDPLDMCVCVCVCEHMYVYYVCVCDHFRHSLKQQMRNANQNGG